MKRLNPQTQKPFKYGNIREDGYVFVCYRTNIVKRNGYSAEYWTKPECFKRNNERALINNKK